MTAFHLNYPLQERQPQDDQDGAAPLQYEGRACAFWLKEE